MQQKSLKKNAFLNTVKTVLTLFFPLITFPYSSRILGPDNLGKVNFAQSIVSYFAIIASLGITTYATREASKVRDDKKKLTILSTEIFVINLISTMVSYILLACSLILIRKLDDYRLIIIICSSLIIFTTIGIDWLYQAMEDYFYITVRSLVFQAISVILLFTLVKSKDDYLWYAAVNIISNVGANILNFIHSRKYITFSLKTKLQLKKHIKPVAILFATAITGSILSSIDTTMLGVMSTDTEVGLYSAGMKIIHMINGIFPAMIIVIFPRVSYYFANNDKKSIQALSEKTMNCLLCLSIPIASGLFLLMNPIITLFCGEKYLEAVIISRIMCPYLIFCAVAHFLNGTLLVAFGKERLQLVYSLANGLFDAILNIFLIRFYAAKGAAFATLLTQISGTIFLLIYHHHFLSDLAFRKSTLQFILAATVMDFAVYYAKNAFQNMLLQLFIPFGVGVFVYALMLFLLRNKFFLETSASIFQGARKKILHTE